MREESGGEGGWEGKREIGERLSERTGEGLKADHECRHFQMCERRQT